MNKKYAGILGAAAAVVVVSLVLVFVSKKGNDEKVVDDFLHTWFEKSEDNQKLAALSESSEGGAAIMGEGVDAETEAASKEASEKTMKEIENVYGKYFTDSAFEKFAGVNYWYAYDIYANSREYEVKNVNISKDGSAYKFTVTLDVDGNEVKEEGRIELQDGKIGSLKIY